MKKLLLTCTLVLVGMTAAAQDGGYHLPDGLLAIEIQANPFSNDFKTFKMGELKARLFLNDKHVVRLGIGLGFDSDKDDNITSKDDRSVNPNNYTTWNETTRTETKSRALKLGLGYEYHFAHRGRLDFYLGAEAGYEAKFYSGTKSVVYSGADVYNAGSGPVQTTTNRNETTSYKKMLPDASKYNEHSIFANIFTGVDFYVYKSLYIGTELGISFKSGKQVNGYYDYNKSEQQYIGSQIQTSTSTTFSSETGIRTHRDLIHDYSNTSVEQVTDHSSKSTNLKIYIEPALRLGWLF